jgi:hypothetical protein
MTRRVKKLEQKMERIIQNQIDHARNAGPGLDGIIHGLRPIKQGKHGSRSSLFYSAKNHALIPVESRLEQAFCYQLEADPNVYMYRTQALAVPYRTRALFPDFLIFDLFGNSYIREIKHSNFIDKERNSEKISYLLFSLARIGLEFCVVTELDLWSGTEKANWRMLYDRGGRLSPSDTLLECVRNLVSNNDSATSNMANVRQQICREGFPFYLLEAALFRGKLRCRMDRIITASTEIQVAS